MRLDSRHFLFEVRTNPARDEQTRTWRKRFQISFRLFFVKLVFDMNTWGKMPYFYSTILNRADYFQWQIGCWRLYSFVTLYKKLPKNNFQ